jgi:hypothetical protein
MFANSRRHCDCSYSLVLRPQKLTNGVRIAFVILNFKKELIARS